MTASYKLVVTAADIQRRPDRNSRRASSVETPAVPRQRIRDGQCCLAIHRAAVYLEICRRVFVDIEGEGPPRDKEQAGIRERAAGVHSERAADETDRCARYGI